MALPALISDHMVLQSGQPTALWGWSAPGTDVRAEFVDGYGHTLATATGTTPASGRWTLQLAALPQATQAGALHLKAGATERTIEDVMVGEVWLGGGQSNMSYSLGSNNIPKAMIDTARDEATLAKGAIRFFTVDWASPVAPQDDVHGHWVVVTPDNFKGCSSVAWNFAVALRQRIRVPVGMIVSAVGGTSVTQWMPKTALDSCPPGPGIEKDVMKHVAEANEKIKKAQAEDEAWLKANPTPELQAKNAASRPRKVSPYNVFSQLYNGMIAGLQPYTIKGVIWFQADGDAGIPFAYGDLIKCLIQNWREGWHAELPFFYVEMNNMYEVPPKEPNQGNDAISILRQQQQAALELPNTDVACSIDCGLLEREPHFPNKKPVGERLALLAFNDVYGMPCEAHSPAYDSFTVEGNKLRLHFKYADGLRARSNGEVIGFEIRGVTGPWLWAQGRVQGDDVLVWNDQIAQPTEVHYAWSMNPLNSMINGAGLPMRPFSTTTIKP